MVQIAVITIPPPIDHNHHTHLEVVEGLHLPTDGVQLGVVFTLDITDGLGQLVLPELAVLRCGVSVGQGGQLLQFLVMEGRAYVLTMGGT